MAALCLLWGCSSPGSSPPPDAGSPDAAVDALDGGGTERPFFPEIPWLETGRPSVALPVLTPCPAGWREVPAGADDAVATCDPYPESGPAACADGEAHFPGEPSCSSIGSACPAGEWPEGLPASGVLYVRAGAAAGGDGSRDRPFGRLSSALAAAPVGATVALSKGRFDDLVAADRAVTVVGACAAETVLAPRMLGRSLAVIGVVGVGPVLVRDLTVSEAPGNAVLVARGELELDGVEIRSARAAAIAMQGGHLVARSLVVRDTQPDDAGLFGRGFEIHAGASAEVSRALVERNRDIGILAFEGGASVRLEDVVVRDTASQASDRRRGSGLVLQLASAELTRVLFERNRAVGVVAALESTLRMQDVVVRDTDGEERGRLLGHGVSTQSAAHAELTRVLAAGNRGVGLFVGGVGSSLALQDVVVRDTAGQRADALFGRGVAVQAGATATARRLLCERNVEAGIFAEGEGASVDLEDVVVRDTASSEASGTDGQGLALQDGVGARVARALLERNRAVGVYASGEGTSLLLEDVAVLDTQSVPSDGSGGRGLSIQRGASGTVSRALVERSREVGVLVTATSMVTLADVVVRDVRMPDCASTGCTFSASVGVAATLEASLEASRFLVDGSELCGVQVATSAALDLREGVVSAATVGACVQVDGYDLMRLSDRVVYVDNGVNLQATSYPAPEPVAVLAEP